MNRLLVFLLVSCAVGVHAQEEFRYAVRREKSGRDETGTILIDRDRILYSSSNGKTTINLPMLEVHRMDLSDSSAIRIETYRVLKRKLGGRQVYQFRLINSQQEDRLRHFLSEALNRPLIASFDDPSEEAVAIAAYHRHRIGGRDGMLVIDHMGIRFVSEDTKDSRTWRYRDIETIGSMNPFHFRVSTFAETYNFDLKQRLPETAYNVAVTEVYRLPR